MLTKRVAPMTCNHGFLVASSLVVGNDSDSELNSDNMLLRVELNSEIALAV